MSIENYLKARAMGPEAIIESEKQGQRDLVESQQLPRECPRQELEALGFVFGDPVNDLFIDVQFPEGWQLRATDHDMWSDLLDPEGNRVAEIFYKAAFYDQRAFMRMV